MTMSRALLFIVVLAGLCQAACAPIRKDGQPSSLGTQRTLQSGRPIGQTFSARDSGLNGVLVLLAPEEPGTGEIRLHLRADSQSPVDIAVGILPLESVTAPGFYRFAFAPQSKSQSRDYFFLLDVQGPGTLGVGTAAGDTYLEGALYEGSSPVDAQMSFQLSYDPTELLIGGAEQVAGWLLALAICALLFILPGWALISVLYAEWPLLSIGERLGLAGGASIALYPLLLLWTAVFGLYLGSANAWILIAVAAAVIVWRNRAFRWDRIRGGWSSWRCSGHTWSDGTLLIVFVVLVGTRLWAIRSLDVPMWGDSYQHAAIAQLLLDHGGLFQSWLPYVPYGTLTVQFGFPAIVAALSWIAGWPIFSATLFVGQILNVLAVMALYPLAMRLTGSNRWAAVSSVLIAGLLSPMPAYYVNWGRYAQLAGQAILPVSLWLLWAALECKRGLVGLIVLASTILAGMLLAYYRMPFFYATFVIALLAGWALPRWGLRWRPWLRAVAIMAIVGTVAAVLFLPWAANLVGGHLADTVEAGVAQGSPLQGVLADYGAWLGLEQYVPKVLQAMTLVAVLWSLVRKQWAVGALGLWVIELASLVAARLIRLPGANMMQNFAVLIALYIPVGLLGGWLVGQIAELLERKGRRIALTPLAVSLSVVALACLGAANQRLIAEPRVFAIVTRPDLRAMSWIRENTSESALFLVEGFRIYDGLSAVGSDAGWWIPLLAVRANSMPPQYALFNEKPLQPGYSQRVVDLVAHLEKAPASSAQAARLMCDWGISHIYVGQLQGRASMEKIQLFAPDELMRNPFFDVLYRQDRVSIFALDAHACETLQ